jgi:hypothetical protein
MDNSAVIEVVRRMAVDGSADRNAP